jgi:hypothetical protein
MAHPGTISDLRYLQRSRLKNEQELVRNYFREIIHTYGTDASYFRHNFNDTESSATFLNYTYGERPSLEFLLSAGMIVYLEVVTDNILMNSFGFETNGDAICYIVKDDFTEQFRDLIGDINTDTFTSNFTVNVQNFSGVLNTNIINSDLSGYISGIFDNLTSGVVSGEHIIDSNAAYSDTYFTGKYARIPVKYSQYMYKSKAYSTRATSGELSGTYYGYIDENGSGIISGSYTGNLSYHIEDLPDNGVMEVKWKIAPQAGDFFRLDFSEENREEYEITKVYDKQLSTSNSMNHLLERYIWRCDVVRRDPSYEFVASVTEEEEWTQSRKDISDLNELISDEIFDYDNEPVDDVDGVNSDNVYGGYAYVENPDDTFLVDDKGYFIVDDDESKIKVKK